MHRAHKLVNVIVCVPLTSYGSQLKAVEEMTLVFVPVCVGRVIFEDDML